MGAIQTIRSSREYQAIDGGLVHYQTDFINLFHGQERAALAFKSQCMAAVEANTDLLDCRPQTLLLEFATAAALGLSVHPRQGEYYIIPRKGVATGQTGYRGLLVLARRGGVIRPTAEVVRTGDHFLPIKGTEPRLEHRELISDYPDGYHHDDAITHAYCTWQEAMHGALLVSFVTVTRHELGLSAERSGSPWDKKWSSFWRDHFAAMARKTAIRRAEPRMPKSDPLTLAVTREYEIEAGQQVGPLPGTETIWEGAQQAVGRAAPAQALRQPSLDDLADSVDTTATKPESPIIDDLRKLGASDDVLDNLQAVDDGPTCSPGSADKPGRAAGISAAIRTRASKISALDQHGRTHQAVIHGALRKLALDAETTPKLRGAIQNGAWLSLEAMPVPAGQILSASLKAWLAAIEPELEPELELDTDAELETGARRIAKRLWDTLIEADQSIAEEWRSHWARMAGLTSWPDQPTLDDYKLLIKGLQAELDAQPQGSGSVGG